MNNIEHYFTLIKMNKSEASRHWNISRTTIHNKIKNGELSELSDGSIDPAEMSRVFGQPKKKKQKLNTKNTVSNEQFFTSEKILFEHQIEHEKQLRVEVERRLLEWKERAEKAEEREQQILQQMKNLTETIKLLEAPKSEFTERQEKKGWLSWLFK